MEALNADLEQNVQSPSVMEWAKAVAKCGRLLLEVSIRFKQEGVRSPRQCYILKCRGQSKLPTNLTGLDCASWFNSLPLSRELRMTKSLWTHLGIFVHVSFLRLLPDFTVMICLAGSVLTRYHGLV